MQGRWTPVIGAAAALVCLGTGAVLLYTGRHPVPDIRPLQPLAAPPALSGNEHLKRVGHETIPDAVRDVAKLRLRPDQRRAAGHPAEAALPQNAPQAAGISQDERTRTVGRGEKDAAANTAPARGDPAAPTGTLLPLAAANPEPQQTPPNGGQPKPAADGPPAAPEADATAPFLEDGVVYSSRADQRFPTETEFQLPATDRPVGQSGSFAAVLHPGWDASSQDDASFFQLGTFGPHLFKEVDALHFGVLDENGTAIDTETNIGGWRANEPHVLTATWGGGQIFLYVDGQLVGQQSYVGALNVHDGDTAWIGSGFADRRPAAPGLLSNVQVYERPLASADVASLATKLGTPPPPAAQ